MRPALLRALRRLFPKLMHKRALSRSEWSEVEEDLLPAVVDPSRAAVDVGAHVGSYTVRLAQIVPRVFAFEPDVELAGLLQRAAPRNVRVSEAPSHGKPVLLYDLKCAGSQAYLRLASEIIQRERALRAA